MPGNPFKLTAIAAKMVSAVFLFSETALAQSTIVTSSMPDTSIGATKDVGLKNGSFVVAPVPFSNVTLGSGLALGGAYLFTLPGSKPSAVGFGAFKTDNGSEGYSFGGNVAFDEGRWTVGLIGGEADIYYDLGIAGRQIPIRQEGKFLRGNVEYGFSSDVNLDVALNHLDTTVALNAAGGGILPPSIQRDVALKINRLDVSLDKDTRDDTFYPTSGMLSRVTFSYGLVDEGIVGGVISSRNRDYAKAVINSAGYWSVGSNSVLAGNMVVCGASDEAPFFDACGLGLVDSLRGFGATDYLADYSASIQAEYRGRISKRFGYVVFAGAGGTGKNLSEAFSGGGGFAAGAGLRIRLSQKFPLDYRIDVAANDDGENSLYISVGQAF